MHRSHHDFGKRDKYNSSEGNKIAINFFHKYTGWKKRISFFTWSKIGEIKNKLEVEIGVKASHQRIFFKCIELRNNMGLEYYAIESGADLYITSAIHDSKNEIRALDTFMSKEIENTLIEVKKALEVGITPKLTGDGTSGSYFLQNFHRKNIGVFKPYDEEPYTPFNPRGYTGKLFSPGIRNGILSGECSSREVAAYLLDEKNKFHGVPLTTFIELFPKNFKHLVNNFVEGQKASVYHSNPNERIKTGSLQLFVENDGPVSDYGRNSFSVEEVHKIAILDVRILNCDRNDENILVKKQIIKTMSESGQKSSFFYKLTPIDHGLSFPDCFDTNDYEVAWVDWPQVKEPFTKAELEFIESIDPIKDVNYLFSKLKIRDICLRNFRAAETLLKKAAKAGLTLYDIARILYKFDEDVPSVMSTIVKKAEEVSDLLRPTIGNYLPESFNYRKPPYLRFNKKFSNSDSKGKKIIEVIAEDDQSEKDLQTVGSFEDRKMSQEDFRLDLKRCQSSRSNRTRAYSDNFSNESPDGSFVIPQLPDIKNLNEAKILAEKSTNDTKSKNSKNENCFDFLNGLVQEGEDMIPRGMSDKSPLRESKGAKMPKDPQQHFDSDHKNKKNDEESKNDGSEEKLVLKRTISLPNLKKKEKILPQSLDIKKLVSVNKENKTIQKKNLQTKKETGDFKKLEKAIDDFFFYYFESFLDQHIILMNSEKKKPKNEYRKRYYSNEYHM